MKKILYLHGFASNSNSEKAQILRKYFGENVFTPTLEIEPKKVIKQLNIIINETGKKVLLIGSSLGGFYALYFSARYNLPALFINPALSPWKLLTQKIGVNKYNNSDNSFEWKEEYNDQLFELNEELNKNHIQPQNLNFALSIDDEIIDQRIVPLTFPKANWLQFYADSGHRFSRFDELKTKIEELIK